MNSFIKIFLILNFIFISFKVFSQTPSFYNYTTKDGLCNLNVVDIQQDELGYLWFTTNHGLSRFDGYKFESFYDAHGLNANNLTIIAMGSENTLFFASSRHGISYYKNGKFGNYETDAKQTLEITKFRSRNDTIFFFEDKKTFSFIFDHKYQKYFKDEKINKLLKDSLELGSLYLGSEGEIYLFGNSGIFIAENRNLKKMNIEGFKDTLVLTMHEDKDKNLWIGSRGIVYIVKNNKVIKKIIFPEKEGIYRIMVDSRGITWFVIASVGISYYKNGELFDIGGKLNINKFKPTDIFEDNQGNIWISVSGKGLYSLNNLYITQFTENDGLSNNSVLKILVDKSGKKLIGTTDGLNLLEGEKISRINIGLSSSFTEWIRFLKPGFKNNYTVSLTGMTQPFPYFYKQYGEFNITYFPTKCSFQIDSVTYLYGNENKIIKIVRKNNTFIEDESFEIFEKEKKPKQITVKDIEAGYDGTIWIGTNRGLVSKKEDERKYYNNDSVLNSNISEIKPDKDNRIWVAASYGISVILPEGKILSFSKSNEIDLRNSLSLTFDNSDNVWIGTIDGLFCISIDSVLKNNISGYLLLNENNGLPSSSVYTVAFDEKENELWAGSVNGMAKIELNNLKKYLKPPAKVIIKNLQLPDTTLNNFENIELDYTQNNIRLNYTSPNFNEPKNIRYEYKIGSENENPDKIEWSKTENTNIELASLSPDNYRLLIRAADNNFRSDITTLTFKINPPFWKTKWFYFLAGILTITTVGFIFNRRIKYLKDKAKKDLEIQSNITALKHEALSASMNPHFIFNTLNSIQYYITTHGKEDANEYIVNFSRLIRMNLDLSGKTLIPLETEINRLELYLKYEKLRFGERLFTEIKVSNDINPETLQIPNMILQPFVENSIWHGLLPKQGNGLVSIEIKRGEVTVNNNSLPAIIIEIKDDGIGLTEAAKHKKSKHISKGQSIIKDRLKLLAPEYSDFEFITIRDRQDKQGAEVIITLLPKHYIEENKL